MSTNVVALNGRLTKDPDLSYTPDGIAVAQFTLAVDRPFTNKQGVREADFIRIIVWRNLAENVANYCYKGSMVGITGRLQTRNYENNQGQRVFVTEVIAQNVQFIQTKNNHGNNTNNNNNNNHKTNNNGQQNPFSDSLEDPFGGQDYPNIDDSDLPF